MIGGWGAVAWLLIAVALFVIEGLTTELVCFWFACGALFAMLAAFVGAPFALQLLIFLITSVSVLIIGRPLLKEKLKTKQEATNADRVIGQLGVVLEQIDNLAQTGRVTANGLDWTARSEYDTVIPKGAKVVVRRIDGVKLIVQELPPEYRHQPINPGPHGQTGV